MYCNHTLNFILFFCTSECNPFNETIEGKTNEKGTHFGTTYVIPCNTGFFGYQEFVCATNGKWESTYGDCRKFLHCMNSFSCVVVNILVGISIFLRGDFIFYKSIKTRLYTRTLTNTHIYSPRRCL